MKTLDEFHKANPNGSARSHIAKLYGRVSTCKPCMKEYSKHHKRKKLYGVTKEQSLNMEINAGGVCEACKQPEHHISMGALVSLCVDHSHTTGKVRGLLCTRCNKLLGMVGDNIEELTHVAASLKEYLIKHNG